MADPKPQRIQLRRTRGFNLQAASRALNGLDAVHCARPSRWGNPYTLPAGVEATVELRARVVAQFKDALIADLLAGTRVRDDFRELRGKNLACWCPLPAEGEPDVCHAAVLLLVSNGGEIAC